MMTYASLVFHTPFPW